MITPLLTRRPVGKRPIGLFGGSFNPAHHGHVDLAKAALTRLQLAEVWWLVSPQNPLKPADETDAFETRFANAKALAKHPRFHVTDLENRLGTSTTAQTFDRLQPLFEKGRFVWLMGADSFAGLHHWNDWQQIINTLPLAVFDRPGWGLKALTSPVANIMRDRQYDIEDAPLLARANAPAFVFSPMPQNHQSSTALRNIKQSS